MFVMPDESPLTLPIGAHVVLREPIAGAQRGSTGRVVRLDGPDYVIGLADGRRLTAGRAQIGLRKALADEIVFEARISGTALVERRTIYAAVVGSRAFGLATDGSDTDTRGVYVAPTDAYWSIAKPPRHVEGPRPEQFSWEVERFCELALKANPNLLEVLHSPLVTVRTPLGEELLNLRAAFLSQLAYQTYNGYVLSQFKKLEADLRHRGAPRWKHAMHLLRLLLSARDLLRDGRLVVDVGPFREKLLAVRRGELTWPQVEAWRQRLHTEVDEAFASTNLPALPDVTRVNAWLYSVRKRGVPQ
jgi:uncharacterized protein